MQCSFCYKQAIAESHVSNAYFCESCYKSIANDFYKSMGEESDLSFDEYYAITEVINDEDEFIDELEDDEDDEDE